MIDTFSDDVGEMDFSRSVNGSGMSSTSKKKKFVAALENMAARHHKNSFHLDEMKQIGMNLGLPMSNFNDLISSLNSQGYLLKKSPKVYQLLSAD
jgi:DNA helicase MCM8